ncbi:hypothetical protein U0035_10035 [Niabella yanshanensis]|uniref:Aspartyl protease n=1 Tax=Niabella yanshanensis TaxID=577386 RepID=A0ABZ0WBE5_9BACT|nr:hypothetical protein [Niabella yanshanensis]WQD40486.1 hypothetical protein U0035_10035 [Niabella yanshanensis]
MKFLSTLLIAISFFVFPVNGLLAQPAAVTPLVLPLKKSVISFEWQGDSVLSKWEAHAAMVIPVKLKDCPRTFYMQFDLGAPSSLFYKNKLDAIRAKYPGAIPLIDKGSRISAYHFWVDGTPVLAHEILVKQFDSSVIDWKEGREIIGTIGADLIDHRGVALDYPGKKIHILPTVSRELKQKRSFSNFTYVNNSVLLPAIINGKETLLFFDTGSSMFELLTNKVTCLQLATTGAKPAQHQVKSWDRTLTANTYASSASINIANTKLSLQSVTYIEGSSTSQVERMLKAGIGGMTGNKLFLHHVLILDTKNQQFAMLPSLKKSDLK